VEGDYALFAGVSAGAIVAAYLAQFQRGAESVAVYHLQDMMRRLKSEDVFKSWPLGRAQGLWKSSFYNTAPLRKLLQREIDPAFVQKSRRLLRIGAVALESSQFVVFDEKCPDLHSAIMASAAFPGFLEPIRINEQTFVDGGVRSYTPISAAIEAGATEIDIVIAAPINPNPMPMRESNALHVMLRAFNIMADEIADKDLELAQTYNALVKAGACTDRKLLKLRVIRPSTELSIDTWDFGSENAGKIRERGAHDAMHVLQAEPT
jgi:predicted acylesterase/phospholipase RssA